MKAVKKKKKSGIIREKKRTISPRSGADATATQFKIGNKGGGRPKSKPWEEELKKNATPETLRKIRMALEKQARKGNVPAIKEYGDRVDGKVLQQIDHSGKINIDLEDAARSLKEIFDNE